jgi:2'-5' RNA ligase
MSPDEMVAFWLMPARAERDRFTSVIAELAARYDAPVFEPHVTLIGGKLDEQKAADVLQRCTFSEPIELEIAGVETSEKYTKTLFVQFRPSPLASELSDAITAAANITSDYEFNPHLSLLYKEMREVEKAAAASRIELPFDRVTFDGLKAIVTPAEITSRKEVEAWRTIGERRCGGRGT